MSTTIEQRRRDIEESLMHLHRRRRQIEDDLNESRDGLALVVVEGDEDAVDDMRGQIENLEIDLATAQQAIDQLESDQRRIDQEEKRARSDAVVEEAESRVKVALAKAEALDEFLWEMSADLAPLLAAYKEAVLGARGALKQARAMDGTGARPLQVFDAIQREYPKLIAATPAASKIAAFYGDED